VTITVAADVRCNWCGIAFASMHPGMQRVPLHHLDDALDALVDAATADRGGYRQGYAVGGPPGCPLHLCRACHDKGTPPRRLPAKPKRTRKAKEAGTAP
jgi:hypothetical protein